MLLPIPWTTPTIAPGPKLHFYSPLPQSIQKVMKYFIAVIAAKNQSNWKLRQGQICPLASGTFHASKSEYGYVLMSIGSSHSGTE